MVVLCCAGDAPSSKGIAKGVNKVKREVLLLLLMKIRGK